MKSALKILAGLAAVIVLLLLLATVVLPLVYDEEDLKQAIAREVYQQTGRELKIEGDLDFSVFPWIAVEVEQLSLGNAAGFGDQPLARIGRARAGVALVPLLQKMVSVDEITLEGLELHLEVDENGRSNWEDLAATEQVADGEDGGAALFSSKRIAGVNVRDANIEYQDRQAGAHYRLAGFSLQAGVLGEGEPLPLELKSAIEDVAAGLRADVEMETTASINLETGHYSLADLELTVRVDESNSPGPAVRIFSPKLDLDLEAGTLAMPAFSLELDDLRADGSVSAEKLFGEATYTGSIEVADFSPVELMQAFRAAPPATADPSVLRHAAFRTRFSGGTSSLGLEDFAMELDDSLVSGNLDLRNFDPPDVRFRFLVDELDVDRYLEPAPETAGADENVVLPQEELKGQEFHGELKIASLKMAGMAFRDADLVIAISNGKLRLHPLTAGFYGGRYSGDVGLDVSGDVPVVSLNESVEAISFQQMIADLVDSEALSGTAQGHVRLSGRGRDSSEVLQSLQGDLGLSLAEGAVEGINIWYQIRRGMALYKGLPAPDPEPARTVFSRLNIDGSVENGVVTTRELVGELPFLALRGSGKVDLGKSQLDLSLVAQVRNSPELARDPLGSGLGGKSLPFRITGALDAPSLKVDWEGLLKSEAAGVLLDKLGLGPKKDAQTADGEESAKSAEPDDSTESTEGDGEEQSSGDQLKETAKGALFELLRKKTQDSEAEEEKDDGQQESGGT